MDKKAKQLRIITFGIIAGMRASFAPAFVNQYLKKHPSGEINRSKIGFVAKPLTGIITKALAAFEIVGDKLPGAPNRTDLPGVVSRVISGAFAGAVIAKANQQSLAKGILLGGVSAAAATFACFHLRKYIGEKTGINNIILGSAEDVAATAMALVSIH